MYLIVRVVIRMGTDQPMLGVRGKGRVLKLSCVDFPDPFGWDTECG